MKVFGQQNISVFFNMCWVLEFLTTSSGPAQHNTTQRVAHHSLGPQMTETGVLSLQKNLNFAGTLKM